jgi:hypothetical protein
MEASPAERIVRKSVKRRLIGTVFTEAEDLHC